MVTYSRSRQVGFTLADVILTVGILAMLGALAVPGFKRVALLSQESAARALLRRVREAQLAVSNDTGRYAIAQDLYHSTPSYGGYQVLSDGRFGPYGSYESGTWKGPYLRGKPLKEAGNRWWYESPIPGVLLVSDGNATGEELAAYLASWITPTASDGTLYRSW
ncbi:MAG: hypothetical protein MUC92_12545 [Fimbriimonadaceae bacterium]|nr:hypothetical protein [Fimbriimonadaceae bacterium]